MVERVPETFCPKCGTRVEQAPYCSQCGTMMSLNDTQGPDSGGSRFLTIPWAVIDVVKGVALYLVALVVVIGILSLFLAFDPFSLNADKGFTTALLFVVMSVGELLMLLAAWRFSSFKYHCGWRSLGFRYPRKLGDAVRLVVIGLILSFLASFIYAIIITALDLDSFQAAEPPSELVETSAGLAVFVILAVLVAPIAEETFFRGFVFPGIGRKYGVWWGAIASAALFAGMHGSLGALFGTFVIGLVLAWVYVRTRSIWACIGCHAAYNSLALITLIHA